MDLPAGYEFDFLMQRQEYDKECGHRGGEVMTDSTTMSIMSKGNETCREIPADVSKTVNLIFIYYFISAF